MMAGDRLVFVEAATASWCHFCPSATEGLKDLSGQRSDFRFVSLIDDHVDEASTRIEDYSIPGFPTVLFDGGYENSVGGSQQDNFPGLIDSCASRDVPNVAVSLEATDRGGSEIAVEGIINNQESRTYSGTLRVHIVERNSRFIDYDGNNYPNALLGYALVEEVSIPSGSSHDFSATWIGSENEDIDGNDFGDIDRDNIVVYAVVFNSRMSVETYPPAKPYTAHYSDAAAEAFPREAGEAPIVEITSPEDGDTVSGRVEITATVSSNEELDMVEVKVGQGNWVEMDLAGEQYEAGWDTEFERNGDYRISVRAVDMLGQTGIDNIEVTLENEVASTPPEISVLTHDPLVPKEGETITIHLELTLHDTTVDSAEAVVCLDGMCLPPKEMFENDIDIFSLAIGPYNAGQIVTYSIVVVDSEGNRVESTENEFMIQDPGGTPGDDDDTLPPVDDDDAADDDDASTGDVQGPQSNTLYVIGGVFVVLIILIVIIIAFALSRRGKKEQEILPAYHSPPPQGYARQLAEDDLELETGVRVK
ncbi:MAG: Ig-like domain-containing protein [Thermoplasmatota archaeon]